jgi:hypothetical protein
MKGNNIIKLNESTMKDAVQMYLDSRAVHNGGFGIVTAVKFDGNTGYFSISIEDSPAEAE